MKAKTAFRAHPAVSARSIAHSIPHLPLKHPLNSLSNTPPISCSHCLLSHYHYTHQNQTSTHVVAPTALPKRVPASDAGICTVAPISLSWCDVLRTHLPAHTGGKSITHAPDSPTTAACGPISLTNTTSRSCQSADPCRRRQNYCFLSPVSWSNSSTEHQLAPCPTALMSLCIYCAEPLPC